MRKTTKALAAAALAAAAFAGAAQAQAIKIGVITDRVGPAKPYAEPVTDGIVFGANELNAKGGVLGRKIELQIEDDQGKPDVSATMARKLVEDGAVMILSVSLTPATQQAQTVTLATKTPHLTPSNSGDTLTTQIDNPYFWQTGPLGSTQIATLLSYARAKNYKRVALVSDNSDLGQLLAKFFRMGLEKAGIEVASEELIPRGATSADAQMQKVRAAKPQALVSAGVLTAENVLMLKAYRQLGINVPVLGSYNLSVPVYMSVAQGLMDGVTFVDAYDPDKPEIKQFVAAYKKGTGKDAYNLNGYGYDGIYLVADAIKRARSTDKEKIRAAMQATKGFHGVMGAKGSAYGFPEGKRTGFDPNGMVVRVYEGDKQGRVVHTGQK
ncbi:MAG TPA: ABC transporter substrate-binding protein [Burkholderiales bacterium]|jgi:branched-chain amino acid transport system substrate-binding protein|nr:ABC transporter substrate-binding protein [Burkholderiales bacterium]